MFNCFLHSLLGKSDSGNNMGQAEVKLVLFVLFPLLLEFERTDVRIEWKCYYEGGRARNLEKEEPRRCGTQGRDIAQPRISAHQQKNYIRRMEGVSHYFQAGDWDFLLFQRFVCMCIVLALRGSTDDNFVSKFRLKFDCVTLSTGRLRLLEIT